MTADGGGGGSGMLATGRISPRTAHTTAVPCASRATALPCACVSDEVVMLSGEKAEGARPLGRRAPCAAGGCVVAEAEEARCAARYVEGERRACREGGSVGFGAGADADADTDADAEEGGGAPGGAIALALRVD